MTQAAQKGARWNVRWMLSAQVLRLVLAFTIGAWVARYLGKADYGVLATALGWQGLLCFVAELGMRQTVVAELSRRGRLQRTLSITSFLIWSLLGWTVFVIGSAVLLWWYWGEKIASIVLIVLSPLLANGFHAVWSLWEGQQMGGRVARIGVVSMLLANALRVLVIVAGGGLPWVALAMVAEGWFSAVASLWISRHVGWWKSRSEGTWRLVAPIMRRATPLFLAHVGTLLLLRQDLIMVQEWLGDEAAGLYGAATRLSEIGYTVGPVTVVLFLPVLSRRFKKDEEGFRRLASSLLGLLTLAAGVGALLWFLAGEWAIRLTFGPEFVGSAAILAVHSLAAIPFLQGEVRTVVMVSAGLQSHAPAWSFVGVVANAGLNAWWIPIMGPVGAAWATLVAYSLVWMLGTVAIRPLRWLAWEQWTIFFRPHRVSDWLRECRTALRERNS